MILANELRIGNFLQDGMSKELIKVIGLYEKGFETRVIDRSKFPLNEGWYTEPIPLTEEWLFKMGFSSSFSSDPQNFPASKLFQLNGFKIHQPIDGVDQFIFEPIIEDYIEFKSVHQFQNLYFALTGTELEIKNK